MGTGTDQTPPDTFSTGGSSALSQASRCSVPVTCMRFGVLPARAEDRAALPKPRLREMRALWLTWDLAPCFARSHTKKYN